MLTRATDGLLSLLAQTPVTQPLDADRLETLLHRIDLGKTFNETAWVGWGLLFLALLVGVIAGKIIQTFLRGFGERMLARDWTTRGTIFRNMAAPANLVLITVGLSVGLTFIALSDPLLNFTTRLLALLYIIALAWFLWNLVDLVDFALRRIARRDDSKLHDMIVPLIRKTLRIFILLVFVLFTAENVFGADITAWLAGLGIAGLAVSLAAQESIKNFFGSITIFMDRPFSIGDRVNVAGHDGTVEEIGFRSTKVRTLIGHVVTIPNSKIVDGSVENISRRLNIRRMLNISVTYDTPPEKMEQAVQIIRDILAEPEIASAFDLEKFPPRVHFNEFNSDNLNIWIIYWFRPQSDFWAYMGHTQLVNMKILRALNDAGIEFAFPTRTLFLAGDQKRELALRLQQ